MAVRDDVVNKLVAFYAEHYNTPEQAREEVCKAVLNQQPFRDVGVVTDSEEQEAWRQFSIGLGVAIGIDQINNTVPATGVHMSVPDDDDDDLNDTPPPALSSANAIAELLGDNRNLRRGRGTAPTVKAPPPATPSSSAGPSKASSKAPPPVFGGAKAPPPALSKSPPPIAHMEKASPPIAQMGQPKPSSILEALGDNRRLARRGAGPDAASATPAAASSVPAAASSAPSAVEALSDGRGLSRRGATATSAQAASSSAPSAFEALSDGRGLSRRGAAAASAQAAAASTPAATSSAPSAFEALADSRGLARGRGRGGNAKASIPQLNLAKAGAPDPLAAYDPWANNDSRGVGAPQTAREASASDPLARTDPWAHAPQSARVEASNRGADPVFGADPWAKLTKPAGARVKEPPPSARTTTPRGAASHAPKPVPKSTSPLPQDQPRSVPAKEQPKRMMGVGSRRLLSAAMMQNAKATSRSSTHAVPTPQAPQKASEDVLIKFLTSGDGDKVERRKKLLRDLVNPDLTPETGRVFAGAEIDAKTVEAAIQAVDLQAVEARAAHSSSTGPVDIVDLTGEPEDEEPPKEELNMELVNKIFLFLQSKRDSLENGKKIVRAGAKKGKGASVAETEEGIRRFEENERCRRESFGQFQ